MELMSYLSIHDLQLAIHLKWTKPLGGLANEKEDDLIHYMRKMIMEAINGGIERLLVSKLHPSKSFWPFTLCLDLK